jgi:hypothetical protein
MNVTERNAGLRPQVSLTTALAAVVLATAASGSESFSLAPVNAGRLATVVDGSSGPEGDWGCVGVELFGEGLSCIVPIDEVNDPPRQSELLSLTKLLFEDTVVISNGPIAAWAADGTLQAIEYDLFGTDDPGAKPEADDCLDVAELLDPSGAVVAKMYCYDAAQYAARVSDLVSAKGGTPLDEFGVFTGPTLQSGTSGQFSMHLLTNGTTTRGQVRSNGWIRIDGDNNSVSDVLRYRESYVSRGEANTVAGFVYEAAVTPLPAPPRTAAQYEVDATANGTFFNDSITIVSDGLGGLKTTNDVPISGVVYSTGNILVQDGSLTASLTLVAEGSIELGGDANVLSAASDHMLAWAVDDGDPETLNDIVVAGEGNHLFGRLYAPGGSIGVLADGQTLLGNLIAAKILVSGDGHSFGDGTKQD